MSPEFYKYKHQEAARRGDLQDMAYWARVRRFDSFAKDHSQPAEPWPVERIITRVRQFVKGVFKFLLFVVLLLSPLFFLASLWDGATTKRPAVLDHYDERTPIACRADAEANARADAAAGMSYQAAFYAYYNDCLGR